MCVLQDWAKPGPYDQPMVNTLRRKKDKEPVDHSPHSVPGPAPTSLPPPALEEDPQRARSMAAPPKVNVSVGAPPYL